ncbi:solute carrier family 13 member 2 [Patella vulgata]|uniref:solute carrier family 13 member 2 n=1 Tax=Patella vulgata TaxID=6465 RepID=UPI00217F4FC6|nr:solute carrier family 13 member 2 [Patella vulgata]
MDVKRFLKELWITKKTLLVISVPILLLPLPLIVNTKEGKCAYGMILMAIFWITEAIPLAMTSLLPVVLFPLFGVQPVKDVAQNYTKEATMFGLGGLMVAIAVEKCNLHKRIALKTLQKVGSEPKWLMFGLMLPTWFLSMWVSNTATTAMMIPIAGAILEQLKRFIEEEDKEAEKVAANGGVENSAFELPEANINNVQPRVKEETNPTNGTRRVSGVDDEVADIVINVSQIEVSESPRYARLCKGFALSVAYSANIGGTGSLSGTGTNLVMQGQTELVFSAHGQESPINFLSWMIYALPGSMICLILAWLWLQCFFMGFRNTLCCPKKSVEAAKAVKRVINDEYKNLGPMSFSEVTVLVHFIVLIMLWFSREPPYLDGWGSLFPSGYVGDSAAAITVCVSLFVFPSRKPSVFCWKQSDAPSESVPAILDWKTVHHKFPWGVLLLIGGGFALADASAKSGLSAWIGDELIVFSKFEPWLMNVLLTMLIAVATEVTSNVTTAALFLPILASMVRIHIF